MRYRAEIDGLRALAVVPVILFHAGFLLFSGGFVGVDIFFVISGYLITTILIEDIDKGRFSIINFYERRARRILPALFFVMLCCVPFAWAWMSPSQMKDFSQSLVATSLFSSNILFWQESGYFEAVAEQKPLLHTWSLAVEEQYYIIFPVFLLFAWRFGRDRVFWIITVLAAISMFLAQWFSRIDETANFYLLPTRAWELLSGSITAFIVQARGVKRNNLVSLAGLLLVIFPIFLYDKSTPFPSLYTLFPVLGVCLIIAYGEATTFVAKLLSLRVFVGIGLVSYSAYLWHQPLLAFSRIRSFEPLSKMQQITLPFLSLVLAYFTWRFVENYFRNKEIFGKQAIFVASTFFILLPIVFGSLGHISSGFKEQRLNKDKLDILKTAIPSPKRLACHTRGKDYLVYDEACNYFSGQVKVATFGDSHVVELSYALAEELSKFNVALKHLSFSDCEPSFDVGNKNQSSCAKWTNEIVTELLQDETIDTVVVSYRINAALFGGHEDTYPSLPSGTSVERRGQVWSGYVNLLKKLVNSGKKTILVLQAPELSKPVEYLIFKSEDYKDEVIGVSRQWWLERTDFLRSSIHDIPKSVFVFDPIDLFCGEKDCLAVENGISYYFDDDHLSISGARLVAVEVVKEILDSERGFLLNE